MSFVTDNNKLDKLESDLATIYLQIADHYKRMSKVKDNYRLDIMQSGIDHALKQTLEVRAKLDLERKGIFDQWEQYKKDTPQVTQ